MIKNIREQKTSGRKLQYDKLLWRLLAKGRSNAKEEFDLAVAYTEGAATYYVADKVSATSKASFVHIDYKEAGYTPLMDQDCYKFMDRIYVVSKTVGEKFANVYPKYQHKIKLLETCLIRSI